MKYLALATLIFILSSCSSVNRKIASEEVETLQHTERMGDYGAGYRL